MAYEIPPEYEPRPEQIPPWAQDVDRFRICFAITMLVAAALRPDLLRAALRQRRACDRRTARRAEAAGATPERLSTQRVLCAFANAIDLLGSLVAAIAGSRWPETEIRRRRTERPRAELAAHGSRQQRRCANHQVGVVRGVGGCCPCPPLSGWGHGSPYSVALTARGSVKLGGSGGLSEGSREFRVESQQPARIRIRPPIEPGPGCSPSSATPRMSAMTGLT